MGYGFVIGQSSVYRTSALLVAGVLWTLPAWAQSPSAERVEFFETHVRPVLSENCFACHTASRMGGLEMTSRASLLKGGNSGPAIEPGKAGESLLVQAVRHSHERLKMPPQGKLAAADIETIATWIDAGAAWPEAPAKTAAARDGEGFVITPEQRNFWAFQPVRKPPLPAVSKKGRNKDWVRAPIDQFVLAKLHAAEIRPVGPADKATLLRRAYIDLTGLPPTPEEIDTFVTDKSSDAFAKVVERLLASPRYGERWGRYWLDVARYSDDKLNSTQMEPYPHAHRYRDWVIRAFNEDMPYNHFVKAQIAGDFMGAGKDADWVAGLGFYGLNPQFQDDRIDATMRGFQGLTVGCAQCHDHKFDPIPTEDYYSLLGIFNSSEIDEFPLAKKETVEEYERCEEKVGNERKALNEFLISERRQLVRVLAGSTASYIVAAWRALKAGGEEHELAARQDDLAGDSFNGEPLDDETFERWVKYLGATPRDHPLFDEFDRLLASNATEDEVGRWASETQRLITDVLREKKKIDRENLVRLGGDANPRKANEVELLSLERDRHFLWRDMAAAQGFDTPVEFESGILYYAGEKIDRFLTPLWKAHADGLRAQVDALEEAMPEKYPFLHVLKDVEKPKNERVHIRGSENNLGAEVPRQFLTVLGDGKPFTQGSGRRELADAIAGPSNPLTARVMVNRIWLQHFGRGIVGTPSNFGQMGERPTHPELLDYLAARFVEEGWSVKAMHREIMLSATYALSSEFSAKNYETDPDNRLLWRAGRRRLDAEALRDSMLYVSGNLDLTPGGEPAALDDPANRRRTVYGYVSRRRIDKVLGLFDFPNPNKTSPRRFGTNTPLQGLFLLNSEFVMRQAERLTDRLERETAGEADRIRRAYRLLYGRRPTKEEVNVGRRFLAGDAGRWPQYAQVLMTSNEFLYVQ